MNPKHSASHVRILSLILGIVVALSSPAAAANFIGPQPHLSFDAPAAGAAVSPFRSIPFQYFYLEDFEDGSLSTPGVTLVEAGDESGPTQTYSNSVDGDDGSIDLA